MSVKTTWVAVLCGLAFWIPVMAQDEPTPKDPAPAAAPAPAETKPAPSAKQSASANIEDPALHRWGGWTIALSAWDPSLSGADENIATVYAGANPYPLMLGSDARYKETARVTFHLPRDRGAVVAQYDAMYQEDHLNNLTPGQFIFGETRGFNGGLQGVYDDGLSDGVQSDALRRTREFRLEYQNKAFETKWARGTWGVGYREISHERALGVSYFAIVPHLPPLVPPATDNDSDAIRLAPSPDTTSQSSSFTGHGLGASLDVEFPLHPRVSIISGLSIALVPGRAEGIYTSTSYYYNLISAQDVPLTPAQFIEYMTNPSPPGTLPPGEGEPPIPPTIAQIGQASRTTSLNSTASRMLAQCYDVYFGVQVIAYKGLRVFATLRDVSYLNVGEYVVPKAGNSVERTNLNASYEAYTLGISYRF